jgi:hypothetical protein
MAAGVIDGSTSVSLPMGDAQDLLARRGQFLPHALLLGGCDFDASQASASILRLEARKEHLCGADGPRDGADLCAPRGVRGPQVGRGRRRVPR